MPYVVPLPPLRLWRLLHNTGLFRLLRRLVSRAGLVGRPRAKPRLIPTRVDPFFMGQHQSGSVSRRCLMPDRLPGPESASFGRPMTTARRQGCVFGTATAGGCIFW
jgi:hypothetical protein